MRTSTFVLCTLILFTAVCPVEARIPLSIAGITLGEDIANYHPLCMAHTIMPLRSEPHLTEVNIDPAKIPGIANGKLAYGTCARPGQIIRIKFKMLNKSLNFFNKLYDRYRKEFGKPDEWRGDPFHNVISWKWAVTDAQKRQVNIVLTHLLDEDLQMVNAIKITLRSQWEKEEMCVREKDHGRKKPTARNYEKMQNIDMERFVPR